MIKECQKNEVEVYVTVIQLILMHMVEVSTMKEIQKSLQRVTDVHIG